MIANLDICKSLIGYASTLTSLSSYASQFNNQILDQSGTEYILFSEIPGGEIDTCPTIGKFERIDFQLYVQNSVYSTAKTISDAFFAEFKYLSNKVLPDGIVIKVMRAISRPMFVATPGGYYAFSTNYEIYLGV